MPYRDDRTETFTYRLTLASDRRHWHAEVYDEADLIVDVFRGTDLEDIEAAVQREYPGATRRDANEEDDDGE